MTREEEMTSEQNLSRMGSVAFSGFPAKSITRRYKGRGDYLDIHSFLV